MSPRIDFKALKLRHAAAKSPARPQADAWFQVVGRADEDRYELVAAACVEVGRGARPYPTTGGTFVEFFMKDWEEALLEVAGRLAALGEEVVVSEPPAPPTPLLFSELTLPCLELIHRLDPPVQVSVRADRHGGLWTLPNASSRHRLNTACSWAIRPGEFGGVGDLGMMPARREDAPAMLTSLFKDIHSVYLNGYFADGSLAHEVVFANLGVSVWRASFGQSSQLERVDALRELLIEFSADIDLGAITLSDTRGPGAFSKRDRMSPWRAVPHLWTSYVPDAHPIQVLGEQHLSRANDLSGWNVENLAPGRYLVQAKDLRPWFDLPADQDRIDWTTRTMREIPSRAVLEEARRDFGDMIIPLDAINM